MIIRLECHDCGGKLKLDYNEVAKVIRVTPCSACFSNDPVRVEDSQILIAED